MSSLRPYSAADPRPRSRIQTANQPLHSGPSSSSMLNHDVQPAQRRPAAGNYSNMTSSAVARDQFGGYNQHVGTISQTGLRALGGLLHTTTS